MNIKSGFYSTKNPFYLMISGMNLGMIIVAGSNTEFYWVEKKED